MKKEETRHIKVNPIPGEKKLNPEGIAYYNDIINSHISFIEKQCRKAVKQSYGTFLSFSNDIEIENEVLELNNIVLDKLREKNYRVLEQFKGNARMSTYITAVISNKAVDLIRKKKGRGREKERAKKFGDIGEKIYEMVLLGGIDVAAAHNELKNTFGFTGTLADIETIIEKIKGKKRLAGSKAFLPEDRFVKTGKLDRETGEILIADTRKNPEDIIIETQLEEKLKEVIGRVISQLKGEERLILRMRFPVSEEKKPEDIERISQLLGISKKAVYNRISRILKRCRDLLIDSGIHFDDLF